MRNIAIVPARSGSKGLKDKNIRLLGEMPLMAYSIKAALDSKLFDKVIVSTDSERYAEIAEKYGAAVPFLRSKENAGDKSSSWDAVTEVMEKLQESYDTIALLQPTSPLRTYDDIINGYKMLEDKNAEAVIGVCEAEHSPMWCNTLPENMCMEKFIPDSIQAKGRQELPQYYRINGALYIIKTSVLYNIQKLYSEKCYAYVMPKDRSIDIDCEMDFKIAEVIMKKL